MKSILSIAAGLLLLAAPVFAEETERDRERARERPSAGLTERDNERRGVGFDCWVGYDGKPYFTSYIRCIADRDLPQAAPLDPESDLLLDLLHRELHTRSGAEAERTMKAHMELVREARAVWSIRIHSYPYEWSWNEGRPEQLVRAVLCPKNVPCAVMIRQH